MRTGFRLLSRRRRILVPFAIAHEKLQAEAGIEQAIQGILIRPQFVGEFGQ